eukprot:640665-Alexandrium_andersonii.AAC.1
MSASLVGSEMCIRDRLKAARKLLQAVSRSSKCASSPFPSMLGTFGFRPKPLKMCRSEDNACGP